MNDRPRGGDVAVLGAGVIGCLVARALARRKFAPIVLQRGGPWCGLAGVSSAAVWDHTEPVEIARLGLDSAERFHQLEEQVGSFGYLMTGGIAPAWTDAEASAHEAFARSQAEAGLPVRWLPRDEVLQREPSLGADVLGATYSPREGVLDANLLARRLLAAAGALGATFVFHAGYVAVEARAGRFLIHSADGDIEVRKLILTSGGWAAEIGAQLGLVVPTRLVRHRAVVTEKLPPLLRHRVAAMRQEPHGEIVLDHVADEDLACVSAVGAMREMAATARRVPALAAARITRTWVWRGRVSSDRRPLVGEVEDGIYVAVPHAPGISLAPLLAHAVSTAAIEGRLPEAAASWDAGRVRPAEVRAARKESPKGP